MGYTVVTSYIDRSTSAFKDTDKRTEFQRMIRDSEKQMWQSVIVYKLDRFARNRYDSATYKAKLKKNGVRVISATENISDNPEGIILEAVLEGMAEFYSKELSQKITRGMHESALKGINLGGHTPLGYKLVNKKLVTDELTAPIVRDAFFMYANGATVAEICEKFNNAGYVTAKGAAFNKNSFRSMFKNERYIGVYKHKDLRVEGGVPAIVDKNTFNTVQKRLIANGKAPARGKAKVDYMLTQKLICGHDKAMMIGGSGTSKSGKVHNYYTCSNRKRYHTCDKKPVKKDVIERLVVQDAMTLLTLETVEFLADEAIRQNEDYIAQTTSVPTLEKEVRDIEKSITNLIKMVEKGADSDSLTGRLNELEKEKRATERRLLEAKDEVVTLEKDHIVWWLSKFIDGDIEDEDFRSHIIDLLVNSVTVWDDPDDPDGWIITAVYNLTPAKSKTFKSSDMALNTPPLFLKHVASRIFYFPNFTPVKAKNFKQI